MGDAHLIGLLERGLCDIPTVWFLFLGASGVSNNNKSFDPGMVNEVKAILQEDARLAHWSLHVEARLGFRVAALWRRVQAFRV